MPPVRFIASKCCTRVVVIILLLSKIMRTCSRCVLKGLVCVIITALSNRQPISYFKCTKLNMCSSCNIRSIFNTKYIFPIRLINF